MSISLWFCPDADLAPAVSATLAAHWLDERERETASRFLFERDRRQYLVAHTLLRRVLAMETGIPEAEAVLRRSPYGRPHLQPPPGGLPRGGAALDFNLARTPGHTLVGVARGHRIGVDVEHLGRGAAALDGIVEGFPRAERDWIGAAPRGRARIRRALRLWTLRQAYAKACDAEGGAEGGAAERGAEGGAGPDAAAPLSTYTFTRADEGGTFAFTVDGRGEGDEDRWCFLEFEPVPEMLAAVAVRIERPAGGPPAVHLRQGFPWARPASRVLRLT
ncbi:4'-phosphopantetheinyl transferase family protein [Streptomyces sp. NPDC059835]|uniref:4'-phosphopantetheinyl transferase family protein n=1 Tax=Streptomyces sp. NPDC059835 TaxID=3346967 RepID=UPI0036535AF3